MTSESGERERERERERWMDGWTEGGRARARNRASEHEMSEVTGSSVLYSRGCLPHATDPRSRVEGVRFRARV
jgi:hypothetical protein